MTFRSRSSGMRSSSLPTSSICFLGRGSSYTATADFERAVQDLNKAIDLAAENEKGLAYFYRGIAHAAFGRYEQAIQDFDRSTFPDSSEPILFLHVHWHRANAHADQGNLDQAISGYDEIIRNSRDPPIWLEAAAYFRRGHAFEVKGDKQRAIADYRSALAITPWNDDVKNALRRLGVDP